MSADYCTCATCGYQWIRYQHGGHSCVTYLQQEIQRLKNAAPQISPKTQVEGSGATYPPSADAASTITPEMSARGLAVMRQSPMTEAGANSVFLAMLALSHGPNDAYIGLKGATDALLRDADRRLAEREALLDAISEALDIPKESWRIAGCDVLAHQVKDLMRSYIALRDKPLAGLSDEQLWTMVRVYHGYKTDAEMVEHLGYDLELCVAKMKQAIAASRATSKGEL
jgi:hypothetical protein